MNENNQKDNESLKEDESPKAEAKVELTLEKKN